MLSTTLFAAGLVLLSLGLPVIRANRRFATGGAASPRWLRAWRLVWLAAFPLMVGSLTVRYHDHSGGGAYRAHGAPFVMAALDAEGRLAAGPLTIVLAGANLLCASLLPHFALWVAARRSGTGRRVGA